MDSVEVETIVNEQETCQVTIPPPINPTAKRRKIRQLICYVLFGWVQIILMVVVIFVILFIMVEGSPNFHDVLMFGFYSNSLVSNYYRASTGNG